MQVEVHEAFVTNSLSFLTFIEHSRHEMDWENFYETFLNWLMQAVGF